MKGMEMLKLGGGGRKGDGEMGGKGASGGDGKIEGGRDGNGSEWRG
jgi:hypothetical protein